MIAVGATLLTIGLSLIIFDRTIEKERENSTHQIFQLVSTVEKTAAISAFLDNKELAEEVTNGLVNNDIVSFAIISSATGMQVVKGAPEDFDPSNASLQIYPLKSPFNSEEDIGSIKIVPNQTFIEIQAKQTALTHITNMGILSFLITVLVIISVHYFLTKPLISIADKLHKIEPGNQQRLKCPTLNANDEIGQLVEDSNYLLAAVEAESKAKSDFLATMSHEIRTPMNGVLGMAQVLQETQLDSDQQHFVNVINSSGKALLNIINDILDYSKIQAGKMEIENIDVDLASLLLDCANVFSLTAEKKQLELFTILDPLTPAFIASDPTRLRQIIINLLGNAFKFTPSGGVTLLAKKTSSENDIFTIRFEIKDTGIGITDEQQKKLFSAFSQADESTTRQFGGTGLGLSISKHLSELMGGEIGVISSEGQGSTFWFSIKCSKAAPDFIKEQIVTQAPVIGSRMLLCDTSPIFLETIRDYAELWGMHVETTADGKHAIELMQNASANNQPFDVVLLNMDMPGPSGFEVAQEMQRTKTLSAIPRVLLSSIGGAPSREEQSKAGITRTIPKPLSQIQVRDLLIGIFSTEESPPVPSDRSHQSQWSDQLKTHKLLVAEDNTVNQLVIKNMLKRLGISCDLASDGQAALQAYMESNQSYSLILMDCEMPQLDGYEATKAIRAFESSKALNRVPVIALTAHAVQEYRDKALNAGMDYHLAKPIELEDLEKALVEYLVKR